MVAVCRVKGRSNRVVPVHGVYGVGPASPARVAETFRKTRLESVVVLPLELLVVRPPHLPLPVERDTPLHRLPHLLHDKQHARRAAVGEGDEVGEKVRVALVSVFIRRVCVCVCVRCCV
jgi:hypothetical protein